MPGPELEIKPEIEKPKEVVEKPPEVRVETKKDFKELGNRTIEDVRKRSEDIITSEKERLEEANKTISLEPKVVQEIKTETGVESRLQTIQKKIQEITPETQDKIKEVAGKKPVEETAEKVIEKKYKLEKISYLESHEKEPGKINFIDRGFLEVSVDNNAISEVLLKHGLSPEQISNLKVIFRPGYYQDRDFHGGVIGGLAEGNTAEVYTSLAIDTSRTIQEHIPIREEELLNSLFHEIMHYIQRSRGDSMSDTFATKSQEEHDLDPQEKEAIQFAEKMVKEMKGVLKIKHFMPKNVFKDPERKTGILNRNIDKIYDAGEKIHFADTDNHVLYFFKKIDKFLASRDADAIREELKRGRDLVEKKKLGIFEYNTLLEKLNKEKIIKIEE
jgi:hypothetical protein